MVTKQKTWQSENKEDAVPIIKRIDTADLVMIFLIDDEGIGYCTFPGKKGVEGRAIMTLITRLEKEKQYLIDLLNKGPIEAGAG